MHMLRTLLAVLIVLLTMTASGCMPSKACILQEDGVARCGILLGITTQEPSLRALAEAEGFAGRNYDLVYRFHGLTSVAPTVEEQKLVQSGRALHINIETRLGNQVDGVSWAQVADGAYDEGLKSQAMGLAELKSPIFVTFDHEMDLPKKKKRGTPKEFISAWRHVHDIFQESGADNVIWVWVASGIFQHLDTAGEMWPGNDVVDWISWDLYDDSGCRSDVTPISFGDSVDLFLNWLTTRGALYGIDESKPLMISETGAVLRADGPLSRANWYADIPTELKKHPQIRAVTLWDHMGANDCDFRFTHDESMREAIRGLGASKAFALLEVSG